MICACYDFVAYCDFETDCLCMQSYSLNPDGSEHYYQDQATIEIQGKSWNSCAKEAKQDGWLISQDRTLAVCPDCRKAGRTIKKARKYQQNRELKEAES